MIAAGDCSHGHFKKNGTRDGLQRYKCCDCGKRWTEVRPRPLGGMYIDLDRAELALKLLVEGTSIRSIERVSGLHRDTIVSLLQLVGERCQKWLEWKVRNVEVDEVQADEIWSFVGMKERTRALRNETEMFGDAWTFVAFDRDSKLVLAWHMGKRDLLATQKFIAKLEKATIGPYQLTTDGMTQYTTVIPNMLENVAYAQLIKSYAAAPGEDNHRYSPATIVSTRKVPMMGNPDADLICTSHIERQNLNFRMCIRRFTRLTNAFSKCWESHEAAMALYIAAYNFTRKHGTIKKTPAMEAGLTDRVWTMRELLLAVAEIAN
jgi:IS1 family transposase/transposase-like protein